MHGLVFRRSIHYWQDQPGSLELRVVFTRCLVVTPPPIRPTVLAEAKPVGLPGECQTLVVPSRTETPRLPEERWITGWSNGYYRRRLRYYIKLERHSQLVL